MERKRFIIQYDELPISVNNYLKPSAKIVKGKPIIHMYESKQAKDWKKRFRAYLQREVRKQDWKKDITSDRHWYLDCVFFQARTNQDNNNYYKLLCDALTGVVTVDDKNILVRTQKVMYDSKNPRFMAVLRPVEYFGIFNDKEEYDKFVIDSGLNPDKSAILRKAREGRVQEQIKRENGIIIYTKKKVKG